jgi:hypothetical protein
MPSPWKSYRFSFIRIIKRNRFSDKFLVWVFILTERLFLTILKQNLYIQAYNMLFVEKLVCSSSCVENSLKVYLSVIAKINTLELFVCSFI